jgi:hypothetical protein
MNKSKCPQGYLEMSSVSCGDDHVAGHEYHDFDVGISLRVVTGDPTIRVHVVEHWGSCQVSDEEHGRKEITSRGNTIDEAIARARECCDRAEISGSLLEQALCLAADRAEFWIEEHE